MTEPTAADGAAGDEGLPADAGPEPEPEPEPPTNDGGAGTTGDPRVDEALARLRELDSLPTVEQVPVLEDVHRRLQDALADLDNG